MDDLNLIVLLMNKKGIHCTTKDFSYDKEEVLWLKTKQIVSKQKQTALQDRVRDEYQRVFKIKAKFSSLAERDMDKVKGFLAIKNIDKGDYEISFFKNTIYLYLSKDITNKNKIESTIKEIILNEGIALECNILEDVLESIPDTFILKTIKIFSPVKFDKIKKEIRKISFKMDESILKRRLDKMCKEKQIVYLKSSKSFSITIEGLKKLPNTRSRLSSDIRRVLVLGKKKW